MTTCDYLASNNPLFLLLAHWFHSLYPNTHRISVLLPSSFLFSSKQIKLHPYDYTARVEEEQFFCFRSFPPSVQSETEDAPPTQRPICQSPEVLELLIPVNRNSNALAYLFAVLISISLVLARLLPATRNASQEGIVGDRSLYPSSLHPPEITAASQVPPSSPSVSSTPET